ncbi:VacB/RNase II family 3'-5' exoribonuclease [Pseudenhygromyxa sp. WMMC2535]|uniref:ribonuclease R family protein n=1 Tax=Pseudenhygromyxa sp. WMMC2535 TaxID=2712867 RepID=UPI001554B6C7|nr:VacB/RNase II family 3'-5' exoribonuclease [Pseudenhygromyxa sp. WMMC2535]NVB40155.1 VacB/RNase II family 3'-5' exoribonuclease [Pseudenhygromyxa sp. WMMC2535]
MDRAWKVRAKLHVTPAGYGFAHPLEGEEERNVFIPPGHLRGALDGDELLVAYWESEKGLEGRVDEIVKRGRTRIVGVLTRAGRAGWLLEVDDPRLIWPVRCPEGPGTGEPGKIVVAQILDYPAGPDPELTVRVQRTVGEAGALETEVQKILIEHGIDDFFSDEILSEAKAVPSEVGEDDLEQRVDLRGLAFMTIDPPDARDFDDAVCVELLGDDPKTADYRLHVAIADVSHYVREGTAIDAEAVERCFSAYLPDRAIPMLPEQLSSHMCSLVPKQDRLAMVVSMRIDARGETSDHQVRAGVIHSRRRLTYQEVARALDRGEDQPPTNNDPLGKKARERVFALRACADRLRAARLRRGAIELDLTEAKVVLDDDDRSRIRDVVKSRSSKSMARAYNLIEELMIAANEGVGELAVAHSLPVVFRVHDKPDEEKLMLLAQAAHSLGLEIDPEKLQHPRGMQKFLSRVTGREYASALNMLMLRAMAQAQYSTENLGHFALASRAYVHFTSPIRRYPDLISHRVMKAWIAKHGGPCGPAALVPRMPKVAESESQALRSSEREREVSAAERETNNLFAALFMRDRIGDRFEGAVSGLSQFGIFVQLDAPFVDGMVKVGDLERDRKEAMQRDETGVRTVGERSGWTLTIGDRVIVEVVDVSVARRQIDLALIETLRA